MTTLAREFLDLICGRTDGTWRAWVLLLVLGVGLTAIGEWLKR